MPMQAQANATYGLSLSPILSAAGEREAGERVRLCGGRFRSRRDARRGLFA